jgi:hypothetical protein
MSTEYSASNHISLQQIIEIIVCQLTENWNICVLITNQCFKNLPLSSCHKDITVQNIAIGVNTLSIINIKKKVDTNDCYAKKMCIVLISTVAGIN